MAAIYTVKIPTKPYLKKFVSKQYGLPFLIDYNSVFGMMLNTLLEKNNYRVLPLECRDKKLHSFTASIDIQKPSSYFLNYRNTLNPNSNSIILINRFLEILFTQELHHYCQKNIQQNTRYPGYQEAIQSYVQKMDIEIPEDITLDALIKAQYRYRKKLEEKSESFVLPKITGINPTLF